MRKVPFFNYPDLYLSDESRLLSTITDVCKRGAFILQQDLEEFEQQLASFLGVKHAFGVADGTNALMLALRAAGIGAGDEVIVPSHTYIASAAAIHFVGATPVLADCGADHLVDPISIEEKISERTRGIMPVHLNGRTCNMDPLLRLAEEHNLIIIEDAAQALGSKFKGKCAGTFGAAGTFSFYPAKVLGCFGDGGAVVTNDDAVAKQLALLHDHGRNEDGEIVAWGTNSRLDNLQAAILLRKLEGFPKVIERRRAMATLYHEQLSSVSELTLPPAPEMDRHYDIYQNFELQAERRDELRAFLSERGIGCPIQWSGKAVHQWEALGFSTSLPKTEAFFQRCFMLPLNMSLSDEDISYVCTQIKEFYG